MDLISPDHYMTLSEDANASFGGRQRKPREKNRGLQTPSPKPKLEAGVKKKKKDESGSQEEHKPKKKTKKTDTAAGPGVINNYHGITFSNIVGSSIVAFCKDGATGGDPTSTGSDPAATNDE